MNDESKDLIVSDRPTPGHGQNDLGYEQPPAAGACGPSPDVADSTNGGTMTNVDDLARHIMDALDLPADVPETRQEQAQITLALEGWFRL